MITYKSQDDAFADGGLFRALVENIRDVPYRLDTDGRITYLGPQALSYDIDPAEVAGQSVLAVVHEDDRARVERDIDRTLTTGDEFLTEFRVTPAAGPTRWMEEHGSVVRCSAGAIVGIQGTLRDITERKWAESERTSLMAQLRLTRQYQRAFTDACNDSVVLWELTPPMPVDIPVQSQVMALPQLAICAEANRAAATALGMGQAYDLVGRAYRDTLRGTAYDDLIEDFVRGSYALVDRPLDVTLHDGTQVSTLQTWHGVVEEGALTHVWAFVRDVTDVRDTERSFEALFDQSSEFSAVLSPAGEVLRVNNAVCRVLLERSEEVLGRPFWHMPWWKTRRETDQAKNAIREAKGGRPVRWVSTDLDRDGAEHTVHASITPIRNEHGEVVRLLALGRDMTELKEAQERVLRSEKMEATGRLAAGIAHDFNNLLTVVLGGAACLSSSLAEDDPMMEDVSAIMDAGEAAAALIRQLLAFGRRQPGSQKAVDVNALLANTTPMMSRLLGEGILLKTSLDPHVGVVQAVPGQIQQVLINLVVNARDAMPNGGEILVQTEHVERSLCPDGLCDVESSPCIRIAVRDKGVGIAKEDLGRIFEPFYTTKPVGKGTGLGLSSVFGIVSQCGGQVDVTSKVGVGTTFLVYLPTRGRPGPLDQGLISHAEPWGKNRSPRLREDRRGIRPPGPDIARGGFGGSPGRDGLD